MKRMLKYFIFFLLFPSFVMAKNPEEFIFRWDEICSKDGSHSNCYNKDLVFENSDSFLISSGENTFELYDKKNGKLLDKSDVYTAMEKFNNNYVAFSTDIDENTGIITTKFVMLDNKLNVLKEKELKNELRYFSRFEIEDNKVVLYDNGRNKYYIDEELNITYPKTKDDGSYTIYLAETYGDVSYVIKYDKNHNELKRYTLENCDYIWNSEYVEYGDYFITQHFSYYYPSGSYKSVKVNTFYLVDNDANLLDTLVIESSTVTYDTIYIGIDGKVYTSHYDNLSTKDETSLVDLVEIKDNKLVLTLVDNPADPVPQQSYTDKIYDDFRNILDKEFKEIYYSFDYEILDNNYYALYLSWNDGEKRIDEVRLYDSSKKQLLKGNYNDYNEVDEIYSTFIWKNGNIGFMVLKDDKILLYFYDENMNLLFELNTGYTNKYFTGGKVTMTSSGMLVKFFRITSLPCGVDEKINDVLAKGFPEQDLYCAMYSNVGFQYYEYPFIVMKKTDGNGNLVVSKEKEIDEGEEVEFTITPSEGYVLGEIKITDMYGNKVDYSDNKFIMPSSDVVIEVIFVKEEKNPDTSDYLTIVLLIVLVLNVIYRYKVAKKSSFLN